MERGAEHLPDELLAAAVELIPIVGPAAGVFTRRSMVKIREEHERRVSLALRAAERIAGLTREELGDAIGEDPELVPLVTRILYAAGMNGYDRTLEAMGRALGDAVRDRDRIDEVDLILTALADLTAAHVSVLQALARFSTENADAPHHLYVREESVLSSRVVELCLAGLVSRGLVDGTTGLDAVTEYEISELGRTLLAVLAELDTDDG
jgi:hypothetical protein